MYFQHNISNGKLEEPYNIKVDKDNPQIKNLYEYWAFKHNKYNILLKNKFSKKLVFDKNKILTIKFKCINWFEYSHNDYLSFIILKARDITNNDTYYFQFRKYNYVIYNQDDIQKHLCVKQMYILSKKKSNIYDIYSHDIENAKELKVKHYDHYTGFSEYCKKENSILENINKINIKNFVIIKTNFKQNINYSSCENTYKDFRYFTVLHDINPSGFFSVEKFKVKQSNSSYYNDNIFLIDDEGEYGIKQFFSKPFVSDKDIHRKYLSFDLESEVTSRNIDSEFNILTHCGIEYFNSLYYNNYKEYQSFSEDDKNILKCSFNFCLINLDFHLRQELKKKDLLKHISLESYYKGNHNQKQYTQLDFYYDYLRSYKVYLDKNTKIINCINSEIYNIRQNKNCYVFNEYEQQINNKKISITDLLTKIAKNKISYLYVKEQTIIEILFKLFYVLNVDYILTYNGHGYDFPQLGRKYSYLNNKTINPVFKIKSMYKYEDILYREIKNEVTNSSIKNLVFQAPYFSVDLYAYFKKFYPQFNSFSLKERGKDMYNIEAIFIKDDEKSNIYETPEKQLNTVYKVIILNQNKNTLFKFYKVLLSSNYCFINDIAYKIIDKTNVIKPYETIYEIDINAYICDVVKKNKVECLLNTHFFIETINNNNNGLKYSIKNNNFTWENYNEFKEVLCLTKDDVEIASSEIFDKESSIDIAKYCIHDTLLCRYLFKDYMVKDNIDTFSYLNLLPQSLALIYRESTNFQGYLFKTSFLNKSFLIKSNKISLKDYSGGKVFDPKENFLVEPVLLLDFESLYPSIMIKYNISPDALILLIDLKCKVEFEIVKKNIENLFDKENYTIVYNEKQEELKFTIMVFTKIDQNKKPYKGLLNFMLVDLKTERNKYKALMKNYNLGINGSEKNQFLVEYYNLLQLNTKQKMNSVYGLLGSNFSIISCKYSSQAITNIGSNAITFLAEYLSDATIVNNDLKINNNLYYNPIIEKPIESNKTYNINYGLKTKLRLEIVYGDTDSIMIIPKGINKFELLYNQNDIEYRKRINVICSFIGIELTKIINEFILKGQLNIEFEAIYTDMIIVTKKKYKSIKTEPYDKFPSEIKQLSDIDIIKFSNSISCSSKEDNKGISLKRRDNCPFHKRTIVEFYKKLHEKINSERFSDIKISERLLTEGINTFLISVRKDLFNQYIHNKINVNDFLISCAYKDKYKNENYYVKNLVEEYNKTAREKILNTDRFKYIYIKPMLKKDRDNFDIYLKNLFLTYTNELSQFKNKEINDLKPITYNDKEFCKIINWEFINTDINQFKVIYDDQFIIDNKQSYRLAFEIYIRNIRNDISTIFSDVSKEIKKQLEKNEKDFIYYLK